MISLLRICDLAIIDELEIELHPGLNILTGETGAGKSIIVGALDLLLGARASNDVIRTGAESATVEGVFSIRHLETLAILQDQAIADPDDVSTVVVRRVIARNGKNRIFINGNLVTATTLRDVTSRLVDMSSQHAQYALLDSSTHLDMVDRFGGCWGDREAFGGYFATYRRLQDELAALHKAEQQRAEREDFLRFQHDEIIAAKLKTGEEEELEADLVKLRNLERLRSGTSAVVGALDAERQSAVERLAFAEHRLRDLAAFDESLLPLLSRLESARIDISDIAFELSKYNATLDMDPRQLDTAEERLALIRKLKRKYGATVAEIIEKGRSIADELERFGTAETKIASLEKEIGVLYHELTQRASQLSSIRRQCSDRLDAAVTAELSSLAMQRCAFQTEISSLDPKHRATFGPTGHDRVEFLVRTNLGEGFLPLAKSASGGELSRILLALKAILLVADPVETSIFDEVDTGVSGAVAEMIARKLKLAAGQRQVLCITHLPQVAAFADHHLKVQKAVIDERTVTRVSILTPDERLEEIARMLGGLTVTDKARDHAREMLKNAG
ncbi:MAG: DNA repair protein RecN [Myxococcales bacterium]|nr:DNA repair protein RecN [Myxococcales bacterium]